MYNVVTVYQTKGTGDYNNKYTKTENIYNEVESLNNLKQLISSHLTEHGSNLTSITITQIK